MFHPRLRSVLPLTRRFRAGTFELAGEPTTAFQLDGEWTGHLPAVFSVERERLRVIC